MAISERTKQVVSRHKAQLRQTFEANKADIDEHKAAIEKIQARNVALKAEFEALQKDIAEPTPVEPK